MDYTIVGKERYRDSKNKFTAKTVATRYGIGIDFVPHTYTNYHAINKKTTCNAVFMRLNCLKKCQAGIAQW